MSLYRRVSIRMYGDEKFRQLSKPKPNAQTLFVYLFTGPHTGVVPGIFVAGERQLAEALEWPLPSFRKCFTELASVGMATADWACRVVYLPQAKYHNPPTNPNIILGWASGFKDLPDCALTLGAWNDFKNYGMSEGMTEAFRQAFAKAFAHGFGNSIGIGREEHRKSIGSGSGRNGSDASSLTSSEGTKPRQPTGDEQLQALARSNQTTADELLRQGHASKQKTRKR